MKQSWTLSTYHYTPQLQKNGSFSMVRWEMMKSKVMMDALLTITHLGTMMLRSTTEDMITKHFGCGVMDEVCHQFSAKASEICQEP
ncbi:hypothetical protein Patl1_15596 [Pistacia atlantica]|uniref:Uncharacterized protein n=1 Tax=Pistacia atlantica TaxID=434234 RepID=A0ACC1B7L4_9ROSI|nr:hypothetical protein Patl1_15596 [Pistacia atlantica]